MFGMRLLFVLLVILSAATLFLALPWVIVFFNRWLISHTVIKGKRLKFNGTEVQLFGSYIKCWLLTLVTFGIYGIFFLLVRMLQWFTKHTVFA
ncbi:hypothetical protein [Metamycoplasma equirhinis]|uniref:hypothetical protein n=1 Tax=Metamycoplasma equirhinis TaxID=92402 RepID=UPI003592F7A8